MSLNKKNIVAVLSVSKVNNDVTSQTLEIMHEVHAVAGAEKLLEDVKSDNNDMMVRGKDILLELTKYQKAN